MVAIGGVKGFMTKLFRPEVAEGRRAEQIQQVLVNRTGQSPAAIAQWLRPLQLSTRRFSFGFGAATTTASAGVVGAVLLAGDVIEHSQFSFSTAFLAFASEVGAVGLLGLTALSALHFISYLHTSRVISDAVKAAQK